MHHLLRLYQALPGECEDDETWPGQGRASKRLHPRHWKRKEPECFLWWAPHA